MGHNVRQKARAGLEPVNLIEVGVGADRRKMHNLVEAVLQTGGLRIEENETHRLSCV